jgi:hypothetical protein
MDKENRNQPVLMMIEPKNVRPPIPLQAPASGLFGYATARIKTPYACDIDAKRFTELYGEMPPPRPKSS